MATQINTKEKTAIKILDKSKIKDESDIERISREIHILKAIRHPNIILILIFIFYFIIIYLYF